MAKVRPVGEMGVQHLEREFVKGYRDGDRVMYISAYNNEELTTDVTEDIKSSWSPNWQMANEAFEEDIRADPDLKHLSGKMFFVWEGNHRLAAWMRHINNHHAEDKDWHVSVHCIVLDPRGQVGNLLHAMHDINWYFFFTENFFYSILCSHTLITPYCLISLFFRSTENDHVKSNFPAKLFRIRSFGVMKLEEFKDLLTPEEYDACLKNKPSQPTWFSLTTRVFIAFLYRVGVLYIYSFYVYYILSSSFLKFVNY